MKDLDQLARQFIEGTWLYNPNDKIVKKTFASNRDLSQLNLIDEEGFLDAKLKLAITHALGEAVLNYAEGPFGDSDIFSGDVFEEDVFYNIELHKISEVTIDTLQKIAGVTLKIEE